ncbi:MAG: hypothetical protein JWO06_2580 [Bacteroidota bacterium]|nr:hypothetical protein [Bacteroidota bacterium]
MGEYKMNGLITKETYKKTTNNAYQINIYQNNNASLKRLALSYKITYLNS